MEGVLEERVAQLKPLLPSLLGASPNGGELVQWGSFIPGAAPTRKMPREKIPYKPPPRLTHFDSSDNLQDVRKQQEKESLSSGTPSPRSILQTMTIPLPPLLSPLPSPAFVESRPQEVVANVPQATALWVEKGLSDSGKITRKTAEPKRPISDSETRSTNIKASKGALSDGEKSNAKRKREDNVGRGNVKKAHSTTVDGNNKKERPPLSLAKELRKDATTLKHHADKIEHSNRKEAVEFYLRAGIKFLESAKLMETNGAIDEACTLYSQTASFFERTARICLDGKSFDDAKQYAALSYKCVAATIARTFACKPDRLRWMKEELHEINNKVNPTTPPGTQQTGTDTTQHVLVSKRLVKEMEAMVKCFDSWNKSETYGEPTVHNMTSSIDYARNTLESKT